jgi:hypothetical protein
MVRGTLWDSVKICSTHLFWRRAAGIDGTNVSKSRPDDRADLQEDLRYTTGSCGVAMLLH